jgi:hypothetical protein
MAPNNRNNHERESYDAAPNKRAERVAIIERGMDLTEEKARLERVKPVDRDAVSAINSQLKAAENDYVKLMKLEFGRNASESRLRKRFKRKINRQARQSLRYDMNHDIDMDPVDVNLNVNIEGSGHTHGHTHASPEIRRRQSRSIDANYAIDDIQADSREHREAIKIDMSIEDYVSNKNALIVIAQKFREDEPQLLAGSLLGGEDMEYAITTAFYPFPVKADQMIAALKEGGAEADAAKDLIRELSANLEPYISHNIEREQLQVEMARDDAFKEGGHALGKFWEEAKRNPLPALIGTAGIAAVIAGIYAWGPPKLKQALGWGSAGLVTAGAVGIFANMAYRSQTDDGSDLFDLFGAKPDDLREDGGRLEHLKALYPELILQNDQVGRDMAIMLDASTDNIHDVFKDAFNSGEETINVRSLSTKDSEIDSHEGGNMNGKASYTALKDYFILLSTKTAKENGSSQRGKSDRQKIEEGLQIFRRRFVNKPEEFNLDTAIRMTIDKTDLRNAAVSSGVSMELGGTELLSESEVAAQRRIEKGLELHGMEADVEYIGTHDGADWVLIDGFPWQYEYDSSRELHTFTDTTTSTVRNVGKTVRDPLVNDSHVLAQTRVNSYYNSPGNPLNGTKKIEWDKDTKEWRTIAKIPSPAVPYLNLAARESHFGVNFDPRKGLKPYVYVVNSGNKEGSPDYDRVFEQYHTDRVEDAVTIHMEPLLGDLGIDVVGYQELSSPNEGEVRFKWGPSLEFEGQATFRNGKISTVPGEFVLYPDAYGPAPEIITEQWENRGDVVADQLVDDNPQVKNAFGQLGDAFAGKNGTPKGTLSDIWTFIESNSNLQNEDTVWLEAVNFQQGMLHAEVKRAVVQAYRDDQVGMMDETTRESKINDIKEMIVKPRIKKIREHALEVAGEANDGGQLSKVKTDEALKLREYGMYDEYADWLGEFEGVMKEKAGLDTVGMEGQERARLIHDAILLTIIEYSAPMHESKTNFENPEAVKWRDNFRREFPLIIASAIADQEGNWWKDQRYNAAGFEEALTESDPPIRPWRSMEKDLEAFQGSVDGSLDIPFYEPEYDSSQGGYERGSRNIGRVPSHKEGELDIDYRIRLTHHIHGVARDIYSDIDDLEYSLREDEFDNFINWRVSRAIDRFVDETDPKWMTPERMKVHAEETVTRLKTEGLRMEKFQAYLEPEGLLDMLNPWMENNLDTLTEAEHQMATSMLLPGHHRDFEDSTEDVLHWLNSRYKNEDVAGFGVPWVRTDVMRLWMEKIEYGDPYGERTNESSSYTVKKVDGYRQFFTNVAQDLMPDEAFSLTDPTSKFKRTDVYGWKEMQGGLEKIPSYEEWIILGAPERHEVDTLDWEEKEEIQEHRNVREQVKYFMDVTFDGDLDVGKLTRFDGRWPELHRAHVLERLEGDVMAKATDPITGRVDPEKLQDQIQIYSKFVRKETVFYNYLIESKVEASDGTSHESLVTAAFIGIGATSGALAGGLGAGSFVTGLGAISTWNPLAAGAAGAGAGVLGGAVGGALGGALGLGAGKIFEAAPLPQIGVQTGEQAHVRIKAMIDNAWETDYVNSANPDPNAYFKSLQANLVEEIKKSIAFDASSIDAGPISIYHNGGVFTDGNIDRMQISP